MQKMYRDETGRVGYPSVCQWRGGGVELKSQASEIGIYSIDILSIEGYYRV